MPEMDGIETMKHIRKSNKFKHMPIIALTAHAILGEKEKLLASGMNDYLSKPLCETELEKVLHKWINYNDSYPKLNSTKLNSNSDNIKNTEGSKSNIISSTKLDKEKIIDFDLSLNLANQNKDLADELLQMLINDLPNTKDESIKLMDKQELENLKHVVHKLHGSCCYCGVPKLKQATNILESSLNKLENNNQLADKHISNLFKDYINNIDLVIKAYGSIKTKEAV